MRGLLRLGASVLAAGALLALPAGAGAAADPAMAGIPQLPAGAAAGAGHCYGYYPITGEDAYTQDCYGHDEPEIDPLSNVAGTGQDITWTIRLPTSSASRPLLDLGPTFWLSAGLADPYSFTQRVFSELQFYPDSKLQPPTGTNVNKACTPRGFFVVPDPGTWSVCDYTWGLYGTQLASAQETAAYVRVVDVSTNPAQALFMHSGDVIKVHIFDSGDAHHDAEQTITDLTTGQSGSLIMYSGPVTGAGSVANPGKGDGPLTLPYSANSLKTPFPWGAVIDTPFGFSWEIGHSNSFTHPTQGECVPGQWDCFSYDTTSSGWGAVTPLQIKSATFTVGGKQLTPSRWGTVDSQGGAAEDVLWCGAYDEPGTPMCTFPWYTYNPRAGAVLFGTTYPGTPAAYEWGQAPKQYDQRQNCPGPLTSLYGFKYYCDTQLSPTPPIP